LYKGVVEVLAEERVREVPEVLLEEGGHVVGAQLVLQVDFLSAVKILSQLLKEKKKMLDM
jgi:hypothetical protein